MSKEAYQETLKYTAKKCIKTFNPDDINFVIATFSLGIHWTGAVATRHNNDSFFCKGPMWIILHMESMNNTYNDNEDAQMNVFVEILHRLFEPKFIM